MFDRTFRDAIRSVIPFAHTDKMEHTLRSVRIEHGIMWATDRHTACWSTYVPAKDSDASTDVVIRLADAKALAAVDGTPMVTVDGSAVTFTYPGGQSFTFGRVDGAVADGEPSPFPDMARFWRESDTKREIDGILLDPKYLARLGKVVLSHRAEPTTMSVRGNVRVEFTFGDHTSVLICSKGRSA